MDAVKVLGIETGGPAYELGRAIERYPFSRHEDKGVTEARSQSILTIFLTSDNYEEVANAVMATVALDAQKAQIALKVACAPLQRDSVDDVSSGYVFGLVLGIFRSVVWHDENSRERVQLLEYAVDESIDSIVTSPKLSSDALKLPEGQGLPAGKYESQLSDAIRAFVKGGKRREFRIASVFHLLDHIGVRLWHQDQCLTPFGEAVVRQITIALFIDLNPREQLYALYQLFNEKMAPRMLPKKLAD